ncbi:MAG: cytidine deaminase [Caldiserica bacterium]|jgi:cytidine deaminase|nr:cytidine deaminase [Caldisericota bacterium]
MKKELIEEATKAREKAYAPYSNFKVGSAVLTKSGKVFTGANIENASYGASICAERVALFKAISEGETEIVEIAVVTCAEEPTMPCGICRQVLKEFSENLKIYAANLEGKVIETTIDRLLPMAFTREDLENKK